MTGVVVVVPTLLFAAVLVAVVLVAWTFLWRRLDRWAKRRIDGWVSAALDEKRTEQWEADK